MSTKKKSSSASAKPAASHKSAAAALQGKPGTALAPIAASALQLPASVTVKRVLTLPSLVMKTPGQAAQLLLLSNMKVSNVDTGKGEAPATVADVVDIETGAQYVFLVPSVVESTWLQNYGTPGEAKAERENVKARQAQYDTCPIVQLAFYLVNRGKSKPSQRHIDFSVLEIEPPQKIVSTL